MIRTRLARRGFCAIAQIRVGLRMNEALVVLSFDTGRTESCSYT